MQVRWRSLRGNYYTQAGLSIAGGNKGPDHPGGGTQPERAEGADFLHQGHKQERLKQ